MEKKMTFSDYRKIMRQAKAFKRRENRWKKLLANDSYRNSLSESMFKDTDIDPAFLSAMQSLNSNVAQHKESKKDDESHDNKHDTFTIRIE